MGKSSAVTAYALLLPALVALAIFRIYPIAATIWGSLCTESFEKAGASVFAGILNYADLFTDPVFWGSIWVEASGGGTMKRLFVHAGYLLVCILFILPPRSENLKVIQVALAGFEERYATLWNELFAAVIIAALIPLIILLPLQRFYVQGVTVAAT